VAHVRVQYNSVDATDGSVGGVRSPIGVGAGVAVADVPTTRVAVGGSTVDEIATGVLVGCVAGIDTVALGCAVGVSVVEPGLAVSVGVVTG
jgi:hypothetical protein